MVVIKDIITEKRLFEQSVFLELLNEFKKLRKLYEKNFSNRDTTKNFMATINSEIETTKDKLSRLAAMNKKNPSDKLRDELCDYQIKLDDLYETCSLFYDEKEKLFRKLIRKVILNKI